MALQAALTPWCTGCGQRKTLDADLQLLVQDDEIALDLLTRNRIGDKVMDYDERLKMQSLQVHILNKNHRQVPSIKDLKQCFITESYLKAQTSCLSSC